MQDGRSDGAMAIEPIRVEELSSQCQFAIVKSEPEFAFELLDQMLTIGQHFRIAVASGHSWFAEDAVPARKK